MGHPTGSASEIKAPELCLEAWMIGIHKQLNVETLPSNRGDKCLRPRCGQLRAYPTFSRFGDGSSYSRQNILPQYSINIGLSC